MSRHVTQRLLQISDPHLFADPEGDLLGQRTRLTLEGVLNLAQANFGAPDQVLLTGDLAQDASPAAYRYLADRCGWLGRPCHALPGNHDDPKEMARSLGAGPVDVPHQIDCGSWRLILLDSTLAGKDAGHLATGSLRRLASALAARPQAPTLVVLHHPPVPVGSPWLDGIGLDNPEDLFAILDHQPQVRGLVFGHIHQTFSAERNGVALLGAPSTCIQFLPGSQDFALDPATPGFRWLELHPDGGIDTGIERIAAYPDPLDLSGAGY
ncbi:MAG: 3',5'-cyclic-AMP phosphodiesterase [Chromatiaceae bacterium]|nr:3',5'-cyclic-AMP phosphodiesterase [Chromatiaceae bacterium]MBP6808725.1 3',5'-cyclic-AMP phosphodiesterase [Chromatiaceae bacterium]MBP8024687.1 3',5'-cyclic-AMP phosphodiesterase [Chromatiaceae bacterium]